MQRTKIQWADYSSNPIYAVRKSNGDRGWACTRVSPGCEHCYSETLNKRLGTGFAYVAQAESLVEWRLNLSELVTWFEHTRPGRVSLCDMTDVFHPQIPDSFLLSVLGVAAMTAWKTYQLLTKRDERMLAFFQRYTLEECLAAAYTATSDSPTLGIRFPLTPRRLDLAMQQGWPPSNTWWGVSVESQAYLPRVDALCTIPASVRFVSLEPLLEAVDLSKHLGLLGRDAKDLAIAIPDLVIVGGESGPGARPMNVSWARSVRDQCKAAGVAYFFRQGGSVLAREWGGKDKKGGAMEDMPDDLRIREYPATT